MPQPQPQPHHHPHYYPSLQQQRSPPLTDHVRESDHRPSNPTPKPPGSVQQTVPQAYLQHLTFQSYQPNRQRYATAHPTPSYGGSKTSEPSQGGLSRTRVSSPGPSHPYHTPGHLSRSHLSGEEGDRPRDSRSLLPSSLEAKGHPMSPPVRSMAPPKPHDRRHVQRFEGYPEGSDYQDGGVGFRPQVDQGKASFHKKGVSHESFSDAHRQGPIRMSVSESDLKESFEAASSGRPHIKHEEVEVDELEEEDVEGEVHGDEFQEEYRQRHPQYSEQQLHELHQRQQQQRQQQQQLRPQQQPHPHHLQAYEYPRDPRDAYHSDPRMHDYAHAMSNPSPSSFSHGYPYPPNQGGHIRHPNQYPHHQAYDQGPGMMRDESRDPNRHPPHGHPQQQPQDPKMPNRRGPYLSRNRALLAGLAASSASGRYKCQYCSKRFSRPSSLRIHTYSHTGERPFKCSEEGCGRQFSVQSNMRRHLRVHRLSRLRSGLPDEDEEEM
ncbi:hypothetical protein BGZ74_007956 [Mortierella antarctica]|nr:hypothetical protein BGZ74_007956 [Mortierella antarctica]